MLKGISASALLRWITWGFLDNTTCDLQIPRICAIKRLTNCAPFWKIRRLSEGFPSGQRDQTVNLTRKLRWFESTSLHQLDRLFQWRKNPEYSRARGMISSAKSLIWLPLGTAIGGHSLMVEPQPSKLMMRVRFPLPAPDKRYVLI